MSKRFPRIAFLIIASLFVSAFFAACGPEESEVPQMQMQVAVPKAQPIVKVDAFTAPANSSITVEKAKVYAKTSAALVELGFRWSERIDKAADAEKVQILNAYNVARDQLCARAGLAGVAEYNWITSVALPDPKNKAVFESVGIRTNN